MSTTICTTPGEPPILPHTSAQKEKRPRISQKKRRRAKVLEGELLHLLDKHMVEPDLAHILQAAINAAHGLANSTRKSDRDQVLFALEGWAALTLEEICDDTGMTRWVVYPILEEFIAAGLVKTDTQYDPSPSQGSSPIIYSLIHTPFVK